VGRVQKKEIWVTKKRKNPKSHLKKTVAIERLEDTSVTKPSRKKGDRTLGLNKSNGEEKVTRDHKETEKFCRN